MRKIMILSLLLPLTLHATPFNLTTDQVTSLGQQIWQRECNKSTEKLVWWNKGEPCASLGIGHFIWFPRTKQKNFTETFPALVEFLIKKNALVPAWLAKNPKQPCPWYSYEHFMQHSTGVKAQELRAMLNATIELQTEFILQRAEKVLPLMLTHTPEALHGNVKKQFYRIVSDTPGIFALIDYVNFKGEGVNPKEQYAGYGWGLRHVLEQMRGEKSGAEALQEFTHSAKKVLEARVAHAPDQKTELHFLHGWKNRIDSYLVHQNEHATKTTNSFDKT